MKNRIAGVGIVFSIILLIILIFPFEREIEIRISDRLLKGLKQISMIIRYDGNSYVEKQYFVDEKFIKYIGFISDKVRLKRSKYDVDIFLIYNDKYLFRKSEMVINYNFFEKKVIEIKE